MEIGIIIILLLVGFGAGFFISGWREKRRTDALDRENGVLRADIASMQKAETIRLDATAKRKRFYEENDASDVKNQIKFIQKTELRAVRPVNKEASSVLYTLEKWIASNRPNWRMGFEVSMGAFIKTPFDQEYQLQDKAHSSYNSKRVDFLLIDNFGQPKLAIEYHGTGHELSKDAQDRMEVKRLALERAGIPLVEILAKAPEAEILRVISERVSNDAP